jgi:hypothetical protein
MSEETRVVAKWTKAHEDVLVDWGDKALCYKWLHMKSHTYYRFYHYMFTIPVIVMSTLTGTANFAQEKLPDKYKFYAPVIIGCINIIAGIITTVQQFLHISELNEAHRVSMIAWDKFYRRIKIELSKSNHERQPISEFFLTTSEEYDRLMESSPIIDTKIINLFKSTFDGTFTNNEVRDMFKQLAKPEVLDSLVSVRNSVYKMPETIIKDNLIKTLTNEIKEQEDNFVRLKDEKTNAIIQEFWNRFQIELLRTPTREELIDNLINEELNIQLEHINEFLKEHEPQEVPDSVL